MHVRENGLLLSRAVALVGDLVPRNVIDTKGTDPAVILVLGTLETGTFRYEL